MGAMDRPHPVTERISIPPAAVETRAVRASGPGGQHVNKVSSKIQMWIDLGLVTGLTGEELLRVRGALQPRLDDRGRLLVSSQETRDQRRNLEDCLEKATELIRAAMFRPKVRRPTKPTHASKERRWEAKKHHAKKLGDRRVSEE